MKIERKTPESPMPADRVSSVRPAASQRGGTAAGRQVDRVEISAAGRQASGELEAAQLVQVSPVPADAPDRLDQIRARVQAGFYVEEQVLIIVAREIVLRGEHRF
jgi:hypothetical protein